MVLSIPHPGKAASAKNHICYSDISYSSKIIGLKADCYFLALGHRILDNVIKSLSLLSSPWSSHTPRAQLQVPL